MDLSLQPGAGRERIESFARLDDGTTLLIAGDAVALRLDLEAWLTGLKTR